MTKTPDLIPATKIDFFMSFTPPTATSQLKGERVIVPKSGKRAFVHHFKKKEVADAEAELWAMLMPFARQYRALLPFRGPVKLHTGWTWPWRAGDSTRARAGGAIWKDTKPDADNCSKILLDQMAKLGFFVNDSQIADIRVLKKFGDMPGIRIIIEQLTNP